MAAAAGLVKEKQNADCDKCINKILDVPNGLRKSNHHNGLHFNQTEKMKYEDYGAFLLDKKVKFANNISRFVNGSAFVSSNENKQTKKLIQCDEPRRTRRNSKPEQIEGETETLSGADRHDDDSTDMLNKSTDVSSPGSSESASSKDSGIVFDDFGCLGPFADDLTVSGTATPVKSFLNFNSCLASCLQDDEGYDLMCDDNRNNSNHLTDYTPSLKSERRECVLFPRVLVDCGHVALNNDASSHQQRFESPSLSRQTSVTPSHDSKDTSISSDLGSPGDVTCKWDKCGATCDHQVLLDHILDMHVCSQTTRVYRCLWQGCKVYNHESSKLSWLKRHVLSHSGTKPFKCIFDGCTLRFCSQKGLERHVNGHLNITPSSASKAAKSREEAMTPTKCGRKKTKLKRKHINLARRCDLFDVKTMEVLKADLHSSQVNTSGSSLTSFHSQIISKKYNQSGRVEYLLHWRPEYILDDEWVDQSDACIQLTRTLASSALPLGHVADLHPSLYRRHRFRGNKRK